MDLTDLLCSNIEEHVPSPLNAKEFSRDPDFIGLAQLALLTTVHTQTGMRTAEVIDVIVGRHVDWSITDWTYRARPVTISRAHRTRATAHADVQMCLTGIRSTLVLGHAHRRVLAVVTVHRQIVMRHW